MDRKLRLFISVELPEGMKNHLAGELSFLKDSGADVKWVSPEKFHLTLKFLGYVDESRVDEIAGLVAGVAGAVEPFEAELSGIGAFPTSKNPRVVWVGVKDPGDRLRGLAGALDEALFKAGFEKEDRPFSAHLTLGRVRGRKNLAALIERLATLRDVSFGKINVADIYVMKSDLKPTGSVYTALKAIGLGKRGK